MAGEPKYGPAVEYYQDAWQRSVLFLDVLRQRSDNCHEQTANDALHVLDFETDVICDGHDLEQPVNCRLVRAEGKRRLAHIEKLFVPTTRKAPAKKEDADARA